MPVPRLPGGRVQISIRTPLRGLTVSRFASDGHLVSNVPDRYATALHLAGNSDWTSGRLRWSSRPGMVSIKVPGDVYTERARDGRADFQVLRFDDNLVDEARTALGRHAITPHALALDPRDPRARPIAALHRLLLDDEPERPAIEEALTTALAALVDLTCGPREPRTPRSAWSVAVARARALLDERITETVGLDELAAHARLDKYRLCRAFRDEVGLPPHAYVTHRRVSIAQDLLARGIPQAEVATSVGLYDQSQLHRHFKRIVGIPPGVFARAAR